MYIVGDVLVTGEIKSECFSCDLQHCKGSCCVEGDAGAPLEESEAVILEKILDAVKPYMEPEAVKQVENTGVFTYDDEGDCVTPLVKNKECVFAYFENGTALCAIEKAYNEGKIDFPKPVSCHLYPLRVLKRENFTALNYHRWDICSAARLKGKETAMPLYRFLKEPLIRYFGERWYEELLRQLEHTE